MSRLHILLLPAYYPSPEAPLNGPFMRDLAQAVSRFNDVTVLAPWSQAAAAEEVDGQVRIIRMPRPRRRGRIDTVQRLWALDRLVRRLRREGRAVDVIHAHYFATGPSAVLVGRLHRIPVVITENATTCLEDAFSAYQARLARFAYRRAAIICTDSALHQDCLRALQPLARYEVVPPVVDVDAFAVSGPRHRETGASRIVDVANLEERKGHHYLIEAVRLLVAEGQEVTLTIVGEGPERPALEGQIRGIPVSLVGSRTREEIRRLLSNSDLFVLPTLADTFGVSPVEAMAAGVQVVVTEAAGCAALLAPLGAKVVPPRDTLALRDVLADLIAKRAQAPADAVEALRDYCGPDAVGQRLDAVYRRVVSVV